MSESSDIAAAVAAARAQGNQAFIQIPATASPDLRAALARLARETKREIVESVKESHAARSIREAAEHRAGLPSVNRNDHRAVLANLDDIAAGKVTVK